MAGGIGSRFWPMSRSNFPKQFHDILGTGKTLIRMTFERFSGFLPPENIFVVTNARYLSLVQEQLPELALHQILPEPIGRNTAPCINYAFAKIGSKNPKATIFVAASDHLILDEPAFLKDAALALKVCSERSYIMTLGIQPSRPDTGYGYIQYIEENDLDPYHKIKTFTEKPELEIAKSFIRSGDFLWNSGMFVFSVNTISAAFEKYLPDMFELFAGIKGSYFTDAEAAAIEDVYLKCKNVSIDIGIMEHAGNVYVIPSDCGWSDLGTWGSMYEHMEKDYR